MIADCRSEIYEQTDALFTISFSLNLSAGKCPPDAFKDRLD